MNPPVSGRPTWAEVDLDALRWNFNQVRRALDPGVKILTVVKANAYGHGAVSCSQALAAAGADCLGVATVEEGAELRRAGLRLPIVQFGLAQATEAPAVKHWRLQPTVVTPQQVWALARVASNRARVAVHLKVDTGMGRIGLKPEDVLPFARSILRKTPLKLAGLYTHFAHADGRDKILMHKQNQALRQVAQDLRAQGWKDFVVHAANSAAVMESPETHHDMVRPGLMLYGLYPTPRCRARFQLKPVLRWLTRIIQLKQVPAGTGLSYGHTFVTRRTSRIATLPLGYADGYSRGFSNRGQVLVHGQVCPIVGRVCMDMCLVDVTSVPGVKLGDEVVVLGRQGLSSLTAEHLAKQIHTISYEVVSVIGNRVTRVFRGGLR